MTIPTMNAEELAAFFTTNTTTGLSQERVNYLTKHHGLNVIPSKPLPSFFVLFLRQFNNPLIYLLLVAAIIIITLGNYSDAIVTLFVVFINAFIGAFHERNTQRTVDKLKNLITISCVVIRDGKRLIIDASELVPGDLIYIQEGDQVPADARIIKTSHLRVNEASLTGESASVVKTTEPLAEHTKSLFEQHNMLFRGTIIVTGAGYAIIIATGKETELGKLQTETEAIQAESKLQQELNQLSHYLLLGSVILAAVLFIIGILIGQPIHDLLILVTALCISIIPEGLPIVFTITLTTGARRLSRRYVLLKRLLAGEGLGHIDTIVIDKTGTLTQNELKVAHVWCDDVLYEVTGNGYEEHGTITFNGAPVMNDHNEHLKLLVDAAGTVDGSEKKKIADTKKIMIKGEPTEAALGIFAHKCGFPHKQYTVIHEEPFDYSKRLKYVIAHDEKDIIVFASGAPESIFKIVSSVSESTQTTLHDFLQKGLRTIGLAIYQTPKTESFDVKKILDKAKGHFTFLGITGIEDELRPEVHNVITHARKAGIRVIMATGDHKTTAVHIAKSTGILQPNDEIITGTELPENGDDYAKLDLETITVYARVTPHQKLMLVKALRQKGYHVAMTGDGINDIPSLAASDIGIAMGSGTDAAKEAADIILVDDSFTSIVKALEEGRHIFATLRRIIWYFFSTNLSELLIIFYAFVLGLPTPLRAAQILWLNVVTDGFLDIALAMEPHEKETLSLQKTHLHLIDRSLMTKILIDGAVMTIGSLTIYHALYAVDLATTQTMMLVCMALFQWFNAWNCRSETQSIWQRGLTSNRLLIMMTMLVLLLQLIIVYVPEFQYLFKTVPLSLAQWGIIIVVASSIIVVEEVRKAIVRAYMHKKTNRF